MRILLIDGTKDAVMTEAILIGAGCIVFITDLGEEGSDLAKLYDYDAIVLNLVLADMPGENVIRQMRRDKVRAPILVLCTLYATEFKVRALALGADDYMTKPFENDELLARLHALVRRSKGHVQSVISIGNLSINLETKRASVGARDMPLTGKEYQILEMMLLRKGAMLTKEMFLNHLYGGRDEPQAKIIDVFICKLRKKMRAFNSHPIETVWGRGYTLREKEDHVSMAAEVADLADDPPTGFVSLTTFSAAKQRPKIPYAGKERV